MLHAQAHEVPRANFPVVDFHQHVNDRVPPEGLAYPPDKLMPADGRRQRAHPGHPHRPARRRPGPADGHRWSSRTPAASWSSPRWTGRAPTSPASAAGRRPSCATTWPGARAGSRCSRSWASTCATARGAWWPSTIRAGIPSGPSAAACSIPVAIHSGDPEAFFHPVRRQERALRGAVGQPRLELPRPRLTRRCPRCWPPRPGCSPATRAPPSWPCTSAAGPRTSTTWRGC